MKENGCVITDVKGIAEIYSERRRNHFHSYLAEGQSL
jgi:hypothetical protein